MKFFLQLVLSLSLIHLHAQGLQMNVPDEVNTIEIILLLGQSNMRGRGAVPVHQEIHPRIIYMNMTNDTWYPAIHPLHTDGVPDLIDATSNAGVGPGLDFARVLADRNPNTCIALIPCARGGSWIDLWMPGKELYDETIRRARKALADFSGQNVEVNIKAALWLQGESDAIEGRYQVYSAKLKTLIDSLRTDLDMPNLPFIAVTIGSFMENISHKYPYYQDINTSLLNSENEIEDYHCVDARDLNGHIGDYIHYNTESQKEIGKRMAYLSFDAGNDTLYIYDNFDIVGNTLTQNGVSGAGWSARWSYVSGGFDPILVHDGVSLAYPSSSSSIASGGYIEQSAAGENIIERTFIDSYNLLNSTFYLSFLMQKDANGSFSLVGFGSDLLRYGLRIGASGAVEARASAGWGESSAEGVFLNDKTYLVVLEKVRDVNKVALFQEGDDIPTDPEDIEWVVVNTGRTGVDMDRFRLLFSSGTVKIDELRMGPTLKSVTQGNPWVSSLYPPSGLILDPDTIPQDDIATEINLSWTDNSDDETGFMIFQDGALVKTVEANVTTTTVSDVYKNSDYYFNVAAYNADGISARSKTEVLHVVNPSGMLLEYPKHHAILYQTIPYFSWNHQAGGPFEGYYEILIDDNSDFSSPVDRDTVPAFINYYSPDFELKQGGSYYWKVRFLDTAYNVSGEWSMTYAFSIAPPEVVVEVQPGNGWDEIRTKWQSVLDASQTVSGAVELRFPENEVFHVRQDPDANTNDRSNGFLLYVDGYDNVMVNGQGSTIILEATHGEWLCGFLEVNNSSGMQVKDIIIDYHPNSLYQIGGVVQNFNRAARTFEVVVDTTVYKTYEVLKHYTEGYFLNREHQQKIGRLGVHFQMEQTWEQARVNDTLFRFTAGSSEYGRYSDELNDGDYFVLSHRGGDIVQLASRVDNFVVNNMTTYASRGRYFAINTGCSNSRCLNNNYLRTQGRIMGSSSGGVGVDRGDNVWYEGNRYEYTRDDMFHNGSNAGKGSVFRRNHLIGAYRNSIWVQADRTWITDNTIEYAGISGIHVGYAPTVPGTVPNVVLIEGNTIIRPNWNGILLRTNVDNPDWETGSIYNENIVIRNNHIIDNYRNEGIRIEYSKHVILENNRISNTIPGWSVYSEDHLEVGVHVSNSEHVLGTGTQVFDNRIAAWRLLKIGENCTNVVFDLLNAPNELKVTGLTSDSVSLTWNDNSPNEDFFRILRRTNDKDPYITIGEVAENLTAFTDTTMVPGMKYYYVVLSGNSAGTSRESNEVVAAIPEDSVNLTSEPSIHEALTVYPNPSADGYFHVSRYSDFLIINYMGRIVHVASNTNLIDLSGMAPGLYILMDELNGEVCKLMITSF